MEAQNLPHNCLVAGAIRQDPYSEQGDRLFSGRHRVSQATLYSILFAVLDVNKQWKGEKKIPFPN